MSAHGGQKEFAERLKSGKCSAPCSARTLLLRANVHFHDDSDERHLRAWSPRHLAPARLCRCSEQSGPCSRVDTLPYWPGIRDKCPDRQDRGVPFPPPGSLLRLLGTL